MNQLKLTIKSELSELQRLADELESFGMDQDWPIARIFNLNLALDELITNTISYGFPEGVEKKDIEISITESGDEILVVLEDEGIAFDPFSEADTPDIELSLDERNIGGLGIFFVKSLTDQTSYKRSGNKNQISLLISTKEENT